MNTILYLIIFLIGVILGYGINLKLNNNVNFKNTIIYGGLLGLLFVIYANSIQLNYGTVATAVSIFFVLEIIYILTILIISIYDKNGKGINKKALLWGFILSCLYNIFLYKFENELMLKNNIIYFTLTCLFLILDTLYEKRIGNPNYTLNVLIFSMLIVSISGELIYILSVCVALISIFVNTCLNKIIYRDRKYLKKENKIKKELPIAFYMGVSNILTTIIVNYILKLYR